MALTQIIDDTYYTAGNASLAFANVNLLMKGGTFSYGLVITGASALDALTAPTITSKCLFGIGCACGACGTIATGFSLFNNTMGDFR